MLTTRYVSIFSAAAFAAFPITAQAKEDLCNKFLPSEMAVGEYNMKFLDGTFSMRGMTIPMHGGETLPATISMMGDRLVLTAPHDFELEFNDMNPATIEEWWPEDNLAKDINIETTDIALCQTIENLPRLLAEGKGSYSSDVGTIPLKVSFLIYDISEEGVFASGMVHGWGSVEGQSFTMKSPIEISPR